MANIENTPHFKQGKDWENQATDLLKKLGFKVIDNSHNFIEPDLIIRKGIYGAYVEAKCFMHKTFDVHKIKTDHYMHYMRRELEGEFENVLYFYFHPEGKHEIFTINMIAEKITNFKSPQYWSERKQYFYHFPRGSGIPYKDYFKNIEVNPNYYTHTTSTHPSER